MKLTPPFISMRQLELALADNNISADSIISVCNNLPEPQKTRALIEWRRATIIERQSPLVDFFGAALGLTAQQIDKIFQDAIDL